MAANSSQQLLKSLEERAKEIETLKRDLQKCEKERNILETQKRTFDGRQPADVQSLLIQKRELHAQLEREESEKHELFTQINQLIGEIAELRSNETANGLSAQIVVLTAENDELKQSFGKKEAAFQSLCDELSMMRAESERRERTHQLEKSRLLTEVQDIQRDLELKTAAFQSLWLATKDGGVDVEQLKVENETLRAEAQEKDDLLRELTDSNDELGRALTASGNELDTLRASLNEAQKRLTENESITCNNQQLEHMQAELEQMRKELASGKAEKSEIVGQSETLKTELLSVRAENARLMAEKNGAVDAEMRADLARIADALKNAKTELRNKESELEKFKQIMEKQTQEMDDLRQAESVPCAQCESEAGELKVARHELTTLKQRVSELDTTLAGSEIDQTKQNDIDLTTLSVERDKLRDELSSTVAKLAHVEGRVNELECALELAEGRATEMQQQSDSLAHKNTLLQSEIVSLNADLDAKKAEIQSSLQNLRIMEDRLQSTESQKTTFISAISDALELPATSKLSTDDLDAAALTFRAELAALRKKVDVARLKQDETLVAELDELRRELSSSREDTKKAQAELALANAEHESNVENIQKTLSEKTDSLNGLLNTLTTDCERLRQAHASGENELRVLRSQLSTLDELTIERQKLEARITELSAAEAKKDAEITRLSALVADSSTTDDKIRELMDENTRLAGDLLKRESATRVDYRAELSQAHDAWLTERRQLEERLNVASMELDRLRAASQAVTSTDNDEQPPAPKPRKMTATPTKTESKNKSVAENEEISRLMAELEKQKRLVMVLRKKLQPELLNGKSSGSTNGTKTHSSAANHRQQ